MAVASQPEPPTGPDWVFELKYDGFRALAYISDRVQLVSRKGHTYQRFDRLCKELAHALSGHEAVLDGEIICVDAEGRPQFYDLLRTRGQPIYAAFDLLWLDGEYLSNRPLIERKARLQKLLPKITMPYSTSSTSNGQAQRSSSRYAPWIWRESWPRENRRPMAEPVG
jgi:bifunctional non-homologous end joining protein LigD